MYGDNKLPFNNMMIISVLSLPTTESWIVIVLVHCNYTCRHVVTHVDMLLHSDCDYTCRHVVTLW
jgi:hypothetical protein